MSYDNWRTSPPEDAPPTKCECTFDDEGERTSDLCEFCELMEKQEKFEAARDAYWERKIDEARGA